MFSLVLNTISALEEMSAMLSDAIETIKLECMMDNEMVDNLSQRVGSLDLLARLIAELKVEMDALYQNAVHSTSGKTTWL
jgi:hypothetical protein